MLKNCVAGFFLLAVHRKQKANRKQHNFSVAMI